METIKAGKKQEKKLRRFLLILLHTLIDPILYFTVKFEHAMERYGLRFLLLFIATIYGIGVVVGIIISLI